MRRTVEQRLAVVHLPSFLPVLPVRGSQQSPVAFVVETPLLPLSVNGAGDATAALFLGHLLRGEGPEGALRETASSVHAVLEETLLAGAGEIRLVAAQDALADPPGRFPARRVR